MPMKRSAAFVFLVVLAVGFPLESHDVVTTSITWNREISRVVYAHCASCHREGGVASTVPLMTYAEARPWAVAIKEEVLLRRMPPWGGIKGFGDFRNDQSLTPEQLEIITSWVEGGVPEGDPKDLPERPKFSSEAVIARADGQIIVNGDTRLRRPFVLDGLVPQKVPQNESLQIVAELPDGSVEPLLWLYEYKPAFPHAFLLQTPMRLPSGTVIRGVPSGSSVILLPPAKTKTPAQ